MPWGVIDVDLKRHVVPVDKDGFVASGHVLGMECRCQPRIDDECPWVVIHEEIQ